jgi:uncharacterized protein (DUF169 family)
MPDYRALERQISDTLQLDRRPVAVTFCDTPPGAVKAFTGVQPSGCSFWKLASEGHVFYTVGADHQNCPIGAHTHNIPLAPERAAELTDTLGFMASIGYLRMEEVRSIPQLPKSPAAVVYAPLGNAPLDPDVVLFCGRPGTLMLLQEAAIRAGVAAPTGALGRPTCMALPAALKAGVVASMGCVGNRVYTGLDKSEMYVAVPARDLDRIATELLTIAAANATLFGYHQDRSAKLRVV